MVLHMNEIACPLCLRRRRARFEYLEMVSALQRRIANQRKELARLQPFERLYTEKLIEGNRMVTEGKGVSRDP